MEEAQGLYCCSIVPAMLSSMSCAEESLGAKRKGVFTVRIRRSQVPHGIWLVPVAPVSGGEVSDSERGSFVLFVEPLLLVFAYPLIDLWR
jgi:hypothetical protein